MERLIWTAGMVSAGLTCIALIVEAFGVSIDTLVLAPMIFSAVCWIILLTRARRAAE